MANCNSHNQVGYMFSRWFLEIPPYFSHFCLLTKTQWTKKTTEVEAKALAKAKLIDTGDLALAKPLELVKSGY